MPWMYGVFVGIFVGLVVGYIAEHVPMAPVLRSVCAATFALLAASIAMTVVWFLRPPEAGDLAGGLGAVSVGFGLDNLLLLVAFGVITIALHLLLGLAGSWAPALALHRATVMGCIGGLCGALSVAFAMRLLTR